MFDNVNIEYGDKTYTIKKNEVLPLIAQVESIVTVVELGMMVGQGKPPLAKIAMALGVVLRYAGASVTDEEIYAEFFNNNDSAVDSQMIIMGLLNMMNPQTENKLPTVDGGKKGKKRKTSNT